MTELKKIRVGELEFDCRFSGEENKEVIIFLHGFPESSFMWSGLMAHLSTQGYSCIAPNMRGYSANACPKGVKNYTVDKISEDIRQIADALNADKFHLIGHDWGAVIGWNLVFNNPKRVISWTALSIPHSRAFGKALKLNKEQKKMSRYIAFFLLPIIPEFIIRRNDFNMFRKLWKNSTSEELENYLSVFRQKGSLTGALNYYRANIGKSKGRQPIGDIATPTLFIWGKNDEAVSRFAAKSNSEYMKGDYTFLEVDGGHWLIQTNYAEVKESIEEHLAQYKTV